MDSSLESSVTSIKQTSTIRCVEISWQRYSTISMLKELSEPKTPRPRETSKEVVASQCHRREEVLQDKVTRELHRERRVVLLMDQCLRTLQRRLMQS